MRIRSIVRIRSGNYGSKEPKPRSKVMRLGNTTLERMKKEHPDFWYEEIVRTAGTQMGFFEPEYRYGGVPFKFVDLFAGIGGFRCGLEPLGGECVYTSEWDRHASETYRNWYNTDDVINDDFREVDYEAIPDHDILCAGFPCQPFSLAGVSSKASLGRGHGFEDEKQGNLFFSLLDVIQAKKPPALFFENVKHLKHHDGGRTWEVIHASLIESGYHVFEKIIDAQSWVPQHRERIFIVCFNREIFTQKSESIPFVWSEPPQTRKTLSDILEKKPDKKYMLSDKLWTYLQDRKQKHLENGHGFGYGIVETEDRQNATTRTISARYHKDGSEILIREKGWRNPRRLTPREAGLLQGFDDETASFFGHQSGFPQCVSDTQAYRQYGNAVVPAVIKAIGQNIQSVLIHNII